MLYMKSPLSKCTLTAILGIGLTALSPAIAQNNEATMEARDNVYKFDTFTELDVDRSGYLENNEYLDYAFGRADWDNDGYLEETEWASYTEVYYDPYELDYDTYTYYDTDGDGLINRSEFNEFPTDPLFTAWDYDGDQLVGDDDWDRVTAHYYDNE